MSNIEIKREKFQRALRALTDIAVLSGDKDRIVIDATIQRFEFTFELAWKFLKDFFMSKGIVLNYLKDALKEAFQVGLIINESLWLQMLNDRNMTSHTYDESLADEIYVRIKSYVPELQLLFDKTKC